MTKDETIVKLVRVPSEYPYVLCAGCLFDYDGMCLKDKFIEIDCPNADEMPKEGRDSMVFTLQKL